MRKTWFVILLVGWAGCASEPQAAIREPKPTEKAEQPEKTPPPQQVHTKTEHGALEIAVTDAAILAAKLDGAMLVLRSGGTRREHAEQAVELLERLNVRMVGAVLTDAQVDTSVKSYYGQ